MKQIAVISGKGGTGKTTLVSSLNFLVSNKMMADCDVDAPNLHILLKGDLLDKREFRGAKEAVIDPSLCTKCGKCKELCRFDAINEDLEVVPLKCEGCGVCTLVCPQKAVHLEEVKTGDTFVSRVNGEIFSHALLDIGAEGSGRLVTEVRKNAKDRQENEEWLIIDGSPGIGCPVIASIVGCDAVIVVSEPTLSGISDLKRVLGVARHFNIPAYVCINKYDLNLEVSDKIKEYCLENGFEVIGLIPFDPSVVKALQDFKTPMDIEDSPVASEFVNIWTRLRSKLKEEENRS